MSFTFRLSSHCNKSFYSCSDSWFISSAFRPDKTDLIRWIYGSAICQLFIEFFLAKNSIWQKRSYEITHRIEFWLCWLLFSLFLHTIKCMFMMRMMLARELVAFCSLNKFCKKGEKGRPSSTAKIRKRFNHVLSNSLIQYKKKKRYGNYESKWEKRSLRQRFDKIYLWSRIRSFTTAWGASKEKCSIWKMLVRLCSKVELLEHSYKYDFTVEFM